MRDSKNEFAKRLDILMILTNTSNEALAKYLGVATSTIANYKGTNRMPELQTAIKLADYFNLSLDFLLGRRGKFVIDEDGDCK